MTNTNAGCRMIRLLEILHGATDEAHPLTTAELATLLCAEGVESSRKTVKADLELLKGMGADILTEKGKRGQEQHFMAGRRFQLPELRLLIDAVGSSRFITTGKSAALIEKLKTLASKYQADTLTQHLFVAERIKPSNETVYYTVDAVASAIYGGRRITFQYIEYTPDKQEVFKHDGQLYALSPYDMIWSDDRYYAVGYSETHGMVATFRMDRMKNVEANDQEARPKPQDYDIAACTKAAFEMFSGESATVELSCANELMKVIVDRFGEDVQTERIDGERFKATVSVSVSPTFFGWVLQFSGRIKILAPPSIREQMIRICQDAIS